VAWLQERHNWPGLKAFVMVESTREFNDKIERETRYYITSYDVGERARPIVRSHWAVENSLHWVMDMIFRDDECRVRTDHAPGQLHYHKTHGPQPDPKGPRQRQLRLKRKVAAWDDEFLVSLIAA